MSALPDSALPDIEVEHEEMKSDISVTSITRSLSPKRKYIQIATTRPETIPGDTAVAVDPEDERYKDLVGKDAGGTGREIPIIADEYVDMAYGTGCVKITPAHDPNDFEVGQRHRLETIVIMNKDGTMNERRAKYVGMDRYKRKAIIDQEPVILVKIEETKHAVGHCSRCKAIVEPMTTSSGSSR